jgi:hypothetical protein
VLDAENNWWGVTDSASIEVIIYHNNDYASAPVVDFMPFAMERFNCDCPGFCDLNLDNSLDPVDVSYIVNYVYLSRDARAPLFGCPLENGDWDGNGDVSPLDVTYYINYVYLGFGTGPGNPCAE